MKNNDTSNSNGTTLTNNIPMNVTVNELSSVGKRSGYLKKLGGKGISKNWRRRFFVLTTTGILYYFKQKTSNQAVGAVDLSQYTKCYKDKSKKNYFFISNENDASQRVFHLIADSTQEMEEWITEITTFFEGDVSDLKQHLMGVKQQKSDSKINVALSQNRDEDLDKFQLVFKGERVSLLLSGAAGGSSGSDQSGAVGGSGTASTSSTTSSPLQLSPPLSPKSNNNNKASPPPIPVRRDTQSELENNLLLDELTISSTGDDSDDS